MSPEAAELEHDLLHPLNGIACSCLCPECWNRNWPAEIAKDSDAVVRICLCPECGCGGWH